MRVEVLEEAGYKSALIGLSLNKDKEPCDMPPVLKKLAFCDGGHNKALEHIQAWLLVTAPRYWWSEADTYRLSSKQSQSTMHTGLKRAYTQADFAQDIPEDLLGLLNQKASEGDLTGFKSILPEGFLQTREWNVSYKTLRNIILQRKTHRLPEWRKFIQELALGLEHPELLPFD